MARDRMKRFRNKSHDEMDPVIAEAEDDAKTDRHMGVAVRTGSGEREKASGELASRMERSRDMNIKNAELMEQAVEEAEDGEVSELDAIRAVAAVQARETSKILKNQNELIATLESAGLLKKASWWESLKKGGIWVKGYYINAGALLAMLVAMKSLRYTVDVEATEGQTETVSFDTITNFFRKSGDEYFYQVARFDGSYSRCNTAMYAGANHVIATDYTPAEVAARNVEKETDLVDDQRYICLCWIYDGANWQCQQLDLSGAEIQDTPFSWFDPADLVNTGIGAGTPLAGLTTTNIYVITAVTPDKKARVVGSLDFAMAAKVAGFMAAVGINRTLGVIYPFVSNTIGNFFTDADLPDFITKKTS